jgi:hypothetical protein
MHGMNGWGFVGGRGGFPQRFEEQYHCYSVAYADKAHLEVRESRIHTHTHTHVTARFYFTCFYTTIVLLYTCTHTIFRLLLF